MSFERVGSCKGNTAPGKCRAQKEAKVVRGDLRLDSDVEGLAIFLELPAIWRNTGRRAPSDTTVVLRAAVQKSATVAAE